MTDINALEEERRSLVLKKYREGLSEQESLRLDSIRVQLDEIDEQNANLYFSEFEKKTRCQQKC